MAYTSGLLKHRVTILNRTEAQQGRFGLDSSGVEFEPAWTVWASVEWTRGKVTKTEYADKIAQRQAWRDDINAAQAEIERLKALDPDPEEKPEMES